MSHVNCLCVGDATRCNTLQHATTRCNTLQQAATHAAIWLMRGETLLQGVAEYGYGVAECCSVYQVRITSQCVAVCCGVLQCVAVCGSVLQYVAECCSVLQCVAGTYHLDDSQQGGLQQLEKLSHI